MSESYYFYPKWVRLWHGLNALLCLALIITGISMQYTTQLNGFIRFDTAVTIHNICGIILTASYLIFVTGNLITSNGRHYRLYLKGLLTDLQRQFYYYSIGIFKRQSPPFPLSASRKFNPLQKFSYVVIMYICMPFIFITGWALLFPEIVFERFLGFDGLQFTDFIHIVIGFFISIFLIIHIYFSTIGIRKSNNFKSIVTGWHQAH
jgi:thiosulfate reductase cytochrome b subunit